MPRPLTTLTFEFSFLLTNLFNIKKMIKRGRFFTITILALVRPTQLFT